MPIYLRVIFAFIYSIGYLYFALDNAGAGHGTFMFWAPLLTWIFVLLSIFLLSSQMSKTRQVIEFTLHGIHYTVTGFLVITYVTDNSGELSRHVNLAPGFVAITIAWYAIGQLIIWFYLVRAIRRTTDIP